MHLRWPSRTVVVVVQFWTPLAWELVSNKVVVVVVVVDVA